MRKKLILFFLILTLSSLLAQYQPGEVVADIVFEDIVWDAGGQPTFTQHSIADLIAAEKAVVIYFFDISYS
ncbi:MAG: hypothetical protein DRH79_08780 [Candidatus Cloacimonadota bacterium]|nr:MAG: hypothetical protein DRH79_08780 [Candidatus Cloacimonadota bacterium]